MAEMTIRLRVNPETGKKDIIIDLHSDDDALPHEHEQLHRKLVGKLIAGGLLSEAELGDVVVERLDEQTTQQGIGDQPAEASRSHANDQRSRLSDGA